MLNFDRAPTTGWGVKYRVVSSSSSPPPPTQSVTVVVVSKYVLLDNTHISSCRWDLLDRSFAFFKALAPAGCAV